MYGIRLARSPKNPEHILLHVHTCVALLASQNPTLVWCVLFPWHRKLKWCVLLNLQWTIWSFILHHPNNMHALKQPDKVKSIQQIQRFQNSQQVNFTGEVWFRISGHLASQVKNDNTVFSMTTDYGVELHARMWLTPVDQSNSKYWTLPTTMREIKFSSRN